MNKPLDCLIMNVTVPAGMHIRQAAELAQDLATLTGCLVRFKFGQIQCDVHPDGSASLLLENYERALDIEILYANNW